MRNIAEMKNELKTFKLEYAKIRKIFHEDRKKGKIHDDSLCKKSEFLRLRIKNLHININQETQSCSKKEDKEFWKMLERHQRQPTENAQILKWLLHKHYVEHGNWSEDEFNHRVTYRPYDDRILIDGKTNIPDAVEKQYIRFLEER